MSKKKVYISLPITGYDIKDVEKRCKSASELIEQLGFEAVSPLEVSSNPNASYEEHIGRDITALLQCDAVIFLEGWHYSNGCSLEQREIVFHWRIETLRKRNRHMSKLYKATLFGKSFIIGWFSHADKWYHKFSIIK